MIDKEYIYDHIGGISAEDLVQYIKQGVVTEAELDLHSAQQVWLNWLNR